MNNRHELVAAARGDRRLDLLVRGGKLVNVLTGTVDAVDIGVVGNRVSCVVPAGNLVDASWVIDARGLYVAPGFVDGHVHNESSMVTPAQWTKLLVARGTTTVFTDPHEIANVLGLEGVRYMLDASRDLPARYFVTAPSCVPAVPSLETAGAAFGRREMEKMLGWERVVAVAEAMDYPGLIAQEGNITQVVEAGLEKDMPIEGHAPGVVGGSLQCYLAAVGPRASDHESHTTAEMLEKVHGGMMVYARASTFMDSMAEVAAALKQVSDSRMFGVCTDDVMPHHLLSLGHMDYGIRRLIEVGVPPIVAYQMATINVAEHFGIRGLGAVAPGWLADFVVLNDLEAVSVRDVVFNGAVVVDHGRWMTEVREPVPPLLQNTVRTPKLTVDSFRPHTWGAGTKASVNAIVTNGVLTELRRINLDCLDGSLRFPLPAGVSLAAMVPRHGQGSPPSLSVIEGFSLARGAIASTVCHDSHNLAVIGTEPVEMVFAAERLRAIGGGLVAVRGKEVLGEVRLPIAGLMSPREIGEVAEEVHCFESVLPALGLPEAFPSALLILGLPVIPTVRLTDRGIVDVASQAFIPFLA